MAKKKVSLEDVLASETTRTQEPLIEASETPRSPAATKRPHVSLYLDPRVQVEIKKLALARGNVRPHDLYLEAVDLLLARHGRPSIRQLTS